ncbi:MAG: hypothetical protein ABI220_05275 [Candidatus Saccharimonadales bacterium]
MNYLDNPGNNVVLRDMQLRKLDTYKVYLPMFRPNLPEPSDRVVASINAIIPTLIGASRAREIAGSHRNFRVGAAALVQYQQGHVFAHQFVHGANIKPVQGLEEINIHAEHSILSKCEVEREPSETASIITLAVVGDIQPDQQSGQATTTLHPCGVCREQFEDPACPVDEETLIVTANPELTTIEAFCLDGLRRLHQSNDPSGILTVQFDHPLRILELPDWYMEGQQRGVVAPPFNDTPEEIADEKEFNIRLILPLLTSRLEILNERATI